MSDTQTPELPLLKTKFHAPFSNSRVASRASRLHSSSLELRLMTRRPYEVRVRCSSLGAPLSLSGVLNATETSVQEARSSSQPHHPAAVTGDIGPFSSFPFFFPIFFSCPRLHGRGFQRPMSMFVRCKMQSPLETRSVGTRSVDEERKPRNRREGGQLESGGWSSGWSHSLRPHASKNWHCCIDDHLRTGLKAGNPAGTASTVDLPETCLSDGAN